MNEMGAKIGFIGCGHMASAIINGILSSKFLPAQNVFGAEISEEFANNKSSKLGIKIFTDNKILVSNVDVIFLATKPNSVKEVLQEIKDYINTKKLIVSIAAGVSTMAIEQELPEGIPVVRVMPNGPALILEGMSGIVRGKFASDIHIDFVQKLLSNIGKCIIIPEEKIDILTAISGSGPAFFYEIIHEMALAGQKLGLDYNQSILLAAQTAIGSAKLILQSELSPAELVKNIATPGGCTEVGVDFMRKSNTEELIYNLIKCTADKASNLGK